MCTPIHALKSTPNQNVKVSLDAYLFRSFHTFGQYELFFNLNFIFSLTMSEAEKNELRRKNNESQKRRREKKRIAMLAENLISDSMTENPILFKEEPSETDCEYRGVVPGGAMAPPDFGTSVNPISAKGGRLCPPYNTGTPGFSDLPTALEYEDRSYDGTFIGLNEIKNEAMDDIKEESCFTDDPLNVGAALTKEKK